MKGEILVTSVDAAAIPEADLAIQASGQREGVRQAEAMTEFMSQNPLQVYASFFG